MAQHCMSLDDASLTAHHTNYRVPDLGSQYRLLFNNQDLITDNVTLLDIF